MSYTAEELYERVRDDAKMALRFEEEIGEKDLANQILNALEDGDYLESIGVEDSDQEVVEEVWGMVKYGTLV